LKIDIKVDFGRTLTLAAALIKMDGLKRGMNIGGQILKGHLMEYAPQPSYVTYKRREMSGGLMSRWTYKQSQDGLTITIGNNADHADDVQGSQSGNPYFKAVWGQHSIASNVRRYGGKVTQIISNEVVRSI